MILGQARFFARGLTPLAGAVLQTKYIGSEVWVTRDGVWQDLGYRARAPTLLGGAGRALNGCRPAEA